jgi:hypothetical protein
MGINYYMRSDNGVLSDMYIRPYDRIRADFDSLPDMGLRR